MGVVNDIHLRGTRAAQPAAAAGNKGYLYCVTDEAGIIERSTGAAWQSYSPTASGSGTVTNTGTLTSGAIVKGNGGVDVSTTTTGANVLTALGVAVGSAGAFVVNGGVLGTPSSGVGTNLTGIPTTALLAGAVVQVVNVVNGAVATGTTTIPFDDTIPAITEGTEFLTLAITPKSATNKLRIDVIMNASASGAVQWVIGALFQDATSAALAASPVFINTATAWTPIVFTHYMTSGTTSATTFRVRLGGNTASTITFNGQSGGRIFGGVLASSITITEIAV